MSRPSPERADARLGTLRLLRDEVVHFRAAPRRTSAFSAEFSMSSGPAGPTPRPTGGRVAVAVPAQADAPGEAAAGGRPAPAPRSEMAVAAAPDHVPNADVAALVKRAQENDAEAFGLLYDRYVDLVYRYVYYRVGSATLAEDLVSETFLRALRRIDSFTWQGRDFAAWLVTIARNLIADHFKSGRYRLEVTTEDILDAAPPQTADGPEGQVLDALTNATLLEAVKRLNPEQQECIVLRFLQGLSVSETALAMGKNDGAIKALQYRAVRALARQLPADALR